MRFSLYSLVRLIAFTTLAASALAVGVSRVSPHRDVQRTPAQPRYIGVNGVTFSPPNSHDYLIDTESGRLRRADFAKEFTIDFATSAPWREPGGRTQVVGRLTSRSGTARDRLCEGSGLGVVDLASGDLIDELETGPVVSSRPCRLPGGGQRIIYSAGDGHLHLSEFNERRSTRTARKVVWECEKPTKGPLLLSDPILPTQREFDGRLFVTLHRTQTIGNHFRYLSAEIWSLRLDKEFTAILEAHRVTEPVSAAPTEDERLPNLTVSTDGRPTLAYLKKSRSSPSWRLIVCPLHTDSSKIFRASRTEEVEIVSDHAATLPAFSPDGRWIFTVARCSEPADSLSRASLKDILDGNRVAMVRRPGDGIEDGAAAVR